MCFEVAFSPGNEFAEPGIFTIQLNSISRMGYNVRFLRQNLTIFMIKDIMMCESCKDLMLCVWLNLYICTVQSSPPGGTIAAIIIVCILALSAAVTLITVTVILFYKQRKSNPVRITGNILHKLFFVLTRIQQITYDIPLYNQFLSYVFYPMADVGATSKSLRKTFLSVLNYLIVLMMS